jgi:DNA-binding transcriptional LysR family regulator
MICPLPGKQGRADSDIGLAEDRVGQNRMDGLWLGSTTLGSSWLVCCGEAEHDLVDRQPVICGLPDWQRLPLSLVTTISWPSAHAGRQERAAGGQGHRHCRFHDNPVCQYLTPALTRTRQPITEVERSSLCWLISA